MVSGAKRTIVHRSYQPQPGYMESALELLLKKTVSKMAAERTLDEQEQSVNKEGRTT